MDIDDFLNQLDWSDFDYTIEVMDEYERVFKGELGYDVYDSQEGESFTSTILLEDGTEHTLSDFVKVRPPEYWK
jgi:hypothetical protein